MSDPSGLPGKAPGKRKRRAWGFAALLALAAASSFAQTKDGALAGKLTDLHSRPLDGVTVTLKNMAAGTEVRTVTGKGGTYRFSGLSPGEYEVEAASPRLGKGSAGGVQVFGGHESRVQTAVALVLEAEAPAMPDQRRHSEAGAEKPALPSLSGPDWETKAPELSTQDLPEQAMLEPTSHSRRLEPVRAADLPATVREAVPEEEADGGGLVSRAVAPALPFNGSGTVVPKPAGVAQLGSGAVVAAVAAAIAQASLLAAKPEIKVAEESDPPQVDVAITGEQMEQLPLPGRHWENFILDTPASGGASDDTETPQGGPARVEAMVTVDGVGSRMAFGGKGSNRAGGTSMGGPGVSETSIQELRVSDAEDAGSSAATGERVHVDSRGGSHGLHGQAFVFNRENLLGAQNPFTQWVKQTAPGTLGTTPVFTAIPYSPGDTENRWGAGAGGELRRNRLFWFASIDGNARNHPAVASVRHPDNFFAQPSNDEMQVLSARLGLSSVNPVAEGLQAYSGMLESLAGLLGPAARTARDWSGFGRLDWKVGERHHFGLEGSGALWNSPGGGLTRASEIFGSHSFGARRGRSTWLLAQWQAFLTPNLLAVTQGSIRRTVTEAPAGAPSQFEQAFNVNPWGQLPQMTVDSRYGFTIGNPARFGKGSGPDEQVLEAQESMTWVHGPFLLKTGLDLRHSADATSQLRNHTGTYFYSSVESFISDALVFSKYGLTDALNPMMQHNCDQRGKAWRDATGQLHGLGYLPCYSHYTQTLGPTEWHLSTNDWSGFVTAQWQPAKQLVMTAGLRWDREDLPPPIALVNNSDLPLTQHLPVLGNAWNPRLGLTWGKSESRWPVLRAGYGRYAGRTNNGVVESALTQTGSLKGDLNFFMRPTDNLQGNGGGAPPFPYVLGGVPDSVEKPGVVEFAGHFHNAEIHQGTVQMEERLPGRILISVSALVSLARRLPVTMDTNYDPGANPKTITYAVADASGHGPIKKPQITVPFFASWPGASGRLNQNYQQITELISRANSTYEAATAMVSRYERHGLSFHARYTYGHAMDWNPNESAQVTGSSVLDPTNFALEYGTSNLDQRHRASAMAIWQAPRNHTGAERWLTNGWLLSGTAQFHSGLPYSMRTAGSITREFQTGGAAIVGLGPGMNGFGGDDRLYGVGRNTYRYPHTWKADVRLGRRIGLGHGREVELLAESFNLFNHQNVTQLETIGYSIQPGSTSGSFPTLNFLTGLKAGQTEFGQPLNINAVDFYRERQFDLGLRMRF